MPRTPTRPWRQWRAATELTTGPSDDVENASRRFLLYGVLPLWFAPAVGDCGEELLRCARAGRRRAAA
ncbi:hypothetical protein ACIG5E_10860 [Kitasatospora sp. NPDC053057]|uniref:hypothetical protein n=1 Tax=Kitasatospora sp. NPDC053057 TaxID=3364062 RepID=UPI0037C65A32